MSSRSMGAAQQVIRPPQRGIFPLDHLGECNNTKNIYLQCLQDNSDKHHKCQDYSKEYLLCRMENQLMSKEDINTLGYNNTVINPKEYNHEKEIAGYIAGKHIDRK